MPAFLLSPAVLPILLLIGSNLFMTFAWYGHLKFTSAPLWIAVMASWGIALVEYWLAVPARMSNRRVIKAASSVPIPSSKLTPNRC